MHLYIYIYTLTQQRVHSACWESSKILFYDTRVTRLFLFLRPNEDKCVVVRIEARPFSLVFKEQSDRRDFIFFLRAEKRILQLKYCSRSNINGDNNIVRATSVNLKEDEAFNDV